MSTGDQGRGRLSAGEEGQGRLSAGGGGSLGVDARGEVRLDRFTLQLDLGVDPGEIVALVGPNGAGKSSTLLCLLGFLPLTGGRISAGGRLLSGPGIHLPPHLRGFGWVPQAPALLPRRPALDQLLVAARAGDGDATGRARALLEAVMIDPGDGRRPRHLSGGEAQRVAVARALTAGTTVLLDEPTSVQDDTGATAIRQCIRRHAAGGGAVVVVAHRPEDAYALADRVVVLEHGRVVQQGPPGALAAAPATSYVAQVVGATVLEGTVGPGGVASGPWGTLTVPDGTPTGPAVLVVRPAAVTIHPEPPAATSSRNLIPGRVTSLTDRDDGVVIRLDGSPPLVAVLTHAAAHELDLGVGDTVWASVKASEIAVTRR